MTGGTATFAALCEALAKQCKWDRLRVAGRVKGEQQPEPGPAVMGPCLHV